MKSVKSEKSVRSNSANIATYCLYKLAFAINVIPTKQSLRQKTNDSNAAYEYSTTVIDDTTVTTEQMNHTHGNKAKFHHVNVFDAFGGGRGHELSTLIYGTKCTLIRECTA